MARPTNANPPHLYIEWSTYSRRNTHTCQFEGAEPERAVSSMMCASIQAPTFAPSSLPITIAGSGDTFTVL